MMENFVFFLSHVRIAHSIVKKKYNADKLIKNILGIFNELISNIKGVADKYTTQMINFSFFDIPSSISCLCHRFTATNAIRNEIESTHTMKPK